jgi:hypothetical protein
MRSRTIHTPDELTEMLQRPTLTLPNAAAVFGLGITSFRAGISRGEIDLPIISVGARKVIPTAAIRRLLGEDQ